MAADVDQLLTHLNVQQATIIGHSMGGKVAMKLADIAADKVAQLVILDMAPVAYNERRHENVIAGLEAVLEQKPSSRSEAMAILARHVEIDGVRQFWVNR